MTTFTSDDRLAAQKQRERELNNLCNGKDLPEVATLEDLARLFDDNYEDRKHDGELL